MLDSSSDLKMKAVHRSGERGGVTMVDVSHERKGAGEVRRRR